MEYTYKRNKITIGSRTVTFDRDIKEVVDFGDCLVVCVSYYNADCNENVYGINSRGELTWQINNMNTMIYKGKEVIGIRDPYAGIVKIDVKTVRLINLDGTRFEVDPCTGNLLSHPIESRIGNRPW